MAAFHCSSVMVSCLRYKGALDFKVYISDILRVKVDHESLHEEGFYILSSELALFSRHSQLDTDYSLGWATNTVE